MLYEVITHLRGLKKRLVAIVAGRRDDGDMLMDLINRGKVYRFLLKPVSPGRARLAVEASVKHHLEAPDSAFKAGGKAAAAVTNRITSYNVCYTKLLRSSLTFMVPVSAAKAEPERPATRMAVIMGPSSLTTAMARRGAT